MSIYETVGNLLAASKFLGFPGLEFHQTGVRQVDYVLFEEPGSNIQKGKFSLSFLPGCEKVMIFHGVVVHPKYRSRGLGHMLHSVRLSLAKRVGVETVMCTVVLGNSVEKRILRDYRWVCSTFISPNIELWTKEIK